MTVPWVNGTVPAVVADLRRSLDASSTGDSLMYAAAVGMISGLTVHDKRPAAEVLKDVRTVCEAVRAIQEADLDDGGEGEA